MHAPISKKQVNERAELARVRILVVDDDASSRHALAKLLQYEGFDVVTAIDGVDALRHLRRDAPYGLVLADVEMPIMNGIELFARVRTELNVPVVLMSAMGPERIVWPSEDHGDGFVPKPIDFDSALPVVMNAIRSVH